MSLRTNVSLSASGVLTHPMARRRNWFSILTGPQSVVQYDIINIIYRNATVTELFVEAKSSGQLDLVETGSGNLRLVEIISNKIFCVSRPEQTLESLQVTRLVNYV